MNYEIIGYVGSAAIAISLLVTNVSVLRYLNSVGCMVFAIYGLAIGAYPVVLMNSICIIINIYHIVKIKNSNKRELTAA
ncbi:MAG: hypothetical protein ACI9LM_004425 [Alteromonadaceae bacterium]|jgi:hypothetical protein